MMSVKKAKSNGDMNILTSLPLKSEITRDSRSPFVHKFQTPLKKYILDVNTNRVLCVDAVTWDIVDEFGVLEKADTIRKYSDKYEPSEISSAYKGITDAQEHNNLLPRSFELAALPDLKVFQESIENKRRRLTLCVTEDCNFRCDYCIYGRQYRTWRNHSKRRMNWEVAQLAIDDFINHSHDCGELFNKPLRFITFYGGESLLNFQLIKRCVLYVREKLADQITFAVLTNGSLLSGEVADFLASENATIQVSLNGPSHIHDYHRHFTDGSGTWKLVTRNIRDFIDKYPQYNTEEFDKPHLCISTTLSPLLNALDVEDFFCFRTPDVIHCNPHLSFAKMKSSDSYYIESLAPEDRKIPGMETLYRRFLSNVSSGLINQNPRDRKWIFQRLLFAIPFHNFLTRAIASPEVQFLDGRSRLSTMCTPGSEDNCFVTVDGSYYPCERGPSCEEFKIGDVWNGIDIAKSHGLKKEFTELCEDKCKRCWCVNNCHISCCAFVRDGARITAEAKQRACDKHREDTHRMLTDLFEVLEANPHAFDFLKETEDHVTAEVVMDTK